MNPEEPEDDGETYAIIGAAIEVHRHLGHGFLESVYHEALSAEFALRGIPFRREAELCVTYKGQALPSSFRADFLCFDDVIVELKAIGEITTREHSQVINYLKATGCSRGLLLNFGTPRLGKKRFIMTNRNATRSSPSISPSFSPASSPSSSSLCPSASSVEKSPSSRIQIIEDRSDG